MRDALFLAAIVIAFAAARAYVSACERLGKSS
jgi:hypothetical protein